MTISKSDKKLLLIFQVVILISLIAIIIIAAILWDIRNSPNFDVKSSETEIDLSRAYPDPLVTPGAVFQNVTEKDVCTPGYTKTVRDVSVKTKKKIYAQSHVSYPQPKVGMYEVDHFIPLELGGSNDESNLWLEPADPNPGFKEKDVVENYLHAQVCASKLSLKDAQEAIRVDWYKVYQTIQNKNYYKMNSYDPSD